VNDGKALRLDTDWEELIIAVLYLTCLIYWNCIGYYLDAFGLHKELQELHSKVDFYSNGIAKDFV
jgi:hypothetical protein